MMETAAKESRHESSRIGRQRRDHRGPHNSSGTQWTPSIMADEVKWLDRKVAGFEMINNAGFATEGLFGGLIREPEIQRRLAFLADRTLQAAREIAAADVDGV